MDDSAAGTTPNMDDLVAQLKAKVAERRKSGTYPDGLEAKLSQHLERLAAHRATDPAHTAGATVEAVVRTSGFDPARIVVDSRMPGGSAFHRGVGKLVSRQTQGVLEQVQEFADAVRVALQVMTEAIQDPYFHRHRDLEGQLDAAFERLAEYEREPIDTRMAFAQLQRRVEELEAAERRRGFRPWFTNAAFEEEFRGSGEDLSARYVDLAQQLVGCSPVIDVGCGRGEFLALLVQQGVEARGVEVDAKLVEQCREQELEVDLAADGIAWLDGAADGSLGGITLIQVVEHLSSQQVVDLIAIAASKLRPGGKLVIETVNPQSLYVYAHAFYVDPTHANPVHPAYLTFLVREAGFDGVAIDWRSAPPEHELLDELPTGDDPATAAFNANVRRLNQLLFASQDYAVIAIR